MTAQTTRDQPLTDLFRRPPGFDRYLTPAMTGDALDHLVQRYPKLVSRRALGRSRQGRPISCYTISGGSRTSIWCAGPHANEVIGGNSAVYLAERLCEDDALRARLDWTTVIVPCIDPDGAALNEGWLAGPFTPRMYHRNLYRPAGDEWPEADMPLNYKKLQRPTRLPEGIILRDLIDDLRPEFMYALHNGEIGGTHCLLSDARPQLPEQLAQLIQTLGFHPETINIEDFTAEPLLPGIFLLPDLTPHFETFIQRQLPGSAVPFGLLSAWYVQRYGGFGLMCEAPYWYQAFSELAPSPTRSLSGVVRETGQRLARFVTWLGGAVERFSDVAPVDSPFLRSLTHAVDFLGRISHGMQAVATTPALDRPATHGEIATIELMLGRSVPQRHRGMMLRLLDEHPDGDRLAGVRREAQEGFEEDAAFLDSANLLTYDIDRQVQLQVGVGILAQLSLAE